MICQYHIISILVGYVSHAIRAQWNSRRENVFLVVEKEFRGEVTCKSGLKKRCHSISLTDQGKKKGGKAI